ncbi:MAG: hypothetical protein ACO3JL_01540 [Myxococcota bacterium]
MSASVVHLVLIHFAIGATPPPWCTELQDSLRALPEGVAPRFEQYSAVAAHVPTAAVSVVEAARGAIEASGDAAAGVAVLQGLARLGCTNAVVEDAAALREEVRRLEQGDPRFAGARKQPDLLARLLERARAFLMEFFESQFMQRYAGLSRTVYLVGLAFVVSMGALRLYRARRARVPMKPGEAHPAVAARAAGLDATALLDEAEKAMREGQLHRCVRAAYLALLVEASTRSLGTFPVAATDRELLTLLGPALERALAPLMMRFQRALYDDKPLARADVEPFLRATAAFMAEREETA